MAMASPTKSQSQQSYSAKDITVLEGLEPVRKRPGMYIGGVDQRGYHHLLWEIVDNAIDEVINGHARRLEVVLHKDGCSATVTDDGRGIPVDISEKHKKTALELILTTLHAGGKFDPGKTYAVSGGLHGVGSSVVNALSVDLKARVLRDGQAHEQTYSRGLPTSKLKVVGPARGTGTQISFRPDPEIFGNLRFDVETVREVLEAKAYLHRGLQVKFVDETSGQTVQFSHQGGIADYLQAILKQKDRTSLIAQPFYLGRENGVRLEVALTWTEATDELVRSFVNGIPTGSGGTHENGLRTGLVKAVRNFIETRGIQPKGVTLTAEDIREGLVALLSVYIAEPQFQGQTKDKLNNPEVAGQVDSALRTELEKFLLENPSVGEALVARMVLAARAREASRAAQAAVQRKTAVSHRLNLPGKLADCASTDPGESELFIVEGDSAGGTAKQGRDRKTQAILPLRGKVLNTEQASVDKILSNKELQDIVSALGCGMGKDFDQSKLRYHKICLLTDADSDGHHIATLLLTFFYRHLRGLIEAGFVYIAQPPLYRIDIGKQTHWALDDHERDKIVATAPKNAKPDIQRFKGLGEMMPQVLKETTLDPKKRVLLKVTIPDGQQLETDRILNELMGRDANSRFRFIMERAPEADELDV
jgi:DNA gyrase subunit B/topoisomerase-4 subunit B